jgi:hypothetical protein
MPIHRNKSPMAEPLVIAPIMDAGVIDWVLTHLEHAPISQIHPGWFVIQLYGGPFDGLHFPIPQAQPAGHYCITLPTTSADRPGGACYARYLVQHHAPRAVFVGICWTMQNSQLDPG